jgi:ABC-type Fe3+ transport system substrate-binding protein
MDKTSTMPTSYEDFTKPEFKDKIVLTYPNDDDAVLYQFDLMYVLPHTPYHGSKD